MPSTRITLALNSNQSTKTPLLLPSDAPLDPTAPKSCFSLVSNAAKTKLRLKKPSRVFIQGTGQELLEENDWKRTLKNDVTLLISAGEEYVGLRRESTLEEDIQGRTNPLLKFRQQLIAQDLEPIPDFPIVNLSNKSVLDTDAIKQLETTARTLPGIIHACGQPDLHPGNQFPIGAVFVSQKWIHPPLIGGDIGCGMAWYKVNIKRSRVDLHQGRRIAERLRGLEGQWRTQADREAWLTETLEDGQKQCWSAQEEWDKALGTIGAGNHFAEIQVVESSQTSEMREDEVFLLVHSGSRGFGGHILKRFTGDTNPSLREGDARTSEYLDNHKRACQWAKANRDLIALRFLACLEPGNPAWELGFNFQEISTGSSEVEEARRKVQERKVVDIWHNNVERISWPPQPPVKSNNLEDVAANLSIEELKQVWVHRKGAAPTYDPVSGQPLSLLPLPGSRSTPTLILRPKFSESTGWGAHNALSLAHGAGRSMSRAKALASLGQKYKNPEDLLTPISMTIESNSSNPADIKQGSWVICEDKELVWEEAPQAYKDVLEVADDLQRAGVAEVIGWCRPRISYKVRHETQ